jgi:LacI family transcriptional regulator
MLPKKASLKDIAARAGVSIALVSYVLNNKKEGRINKDLAQRIREIATQLNYRANQIAKSLKTSKTNTIGLIVADISNNFSSNLARIIEDEADKFGYTVIFGSSDENEKKFSKLLDTLVNRQVDGLIMAPPINSENEIRELIRQQIPFVLIDRFYPDIDTNYVALDNYAAAYKGTKHLIENGRTNIGMITYGTALHHLEERKRGFIAALKDNHLPYNKARLKEVDIITKKEDIENAIDDLLAAPHSIDALFFGSNSIALHGLKYVNSLDIRVPEDLAIISFDETEALDLFYAPLTFIRQPLPEMGESAVKMLIENIGLTNKLTQVVMEGRLIVKASTKATKQKR